MPEVQIRLAVATDIKKLMEFDHSCLSDYVWQCDIQRTEEQVSSAFREIRLPRSISVQYPRAISTLPDDWNFQSGMLVALINQQVCGYLRLTDHLLPETSWITDLVVESGFRKKGVGRSLILAAQAWACERQKTRIIMEMTSKNSAAIHLAKKMGFEFCGFNDQYYANNEVAIYFGRNI